MKIFRFFPFTWLLALVLAFGVAAPALGQTGGIVVEIPTQLGGVVDEGEFRPALEAWVSECNQIIGRFKALSPAQADKLFADEDPFGAADQSDCLARLSASVADVLDRWLVVDEAEMTTGERAVLAALRKSGLALESSEGTPFLMVDRAFFTPLLKPYLSPDGADYMAVVDRQPPFLISDAGLVYGLPDVGAFAVQWEEFLYAHPDSAYAKNAGERFWGLLNLLMFCDLDNTPAFPLFNDGKMEDEWRDGLAAVVKSHPGTRTAAIIGDYLVAIEADGFKLSPKNKEAFSQRMKEVTRAK